MLEFLLSFDFNSSKMCSQNFNSLSEPAETSSSFIMFSIRNSASEAFPQHSPLRILRTLAMKRHADLSVRQVLCGCLGPVAAQLRDLSGQRTSLKRRILPKWVDVSRNYIMGQEERVKFSLQMAACTLRASSVVQLHLSVRLQS